MAEARKSEGGGGGGRGRHIVGRQCGRSILGERGRGAKGGGGGRGASDAYNSTGTCAPCSARMVTARDSID